MVGRPSLATPDDLYQVGTDITGILDDDTYLIPIGIVQDARVDGFEDVSLAALSSSVDQTFSLDFLFETDRGAQDDQISWSEVLYLRFRDLQMALRII